ncbi:MAG TPA: hypothetical protein VMU51_25250 [Mycobacteriales bacterium]|nr:hypothetical protein [Mycobacteriales bacterium]
MRWTGPNTEVIDVIQLRGKDNVTRTLYRLRRHGLWVANCASLDELAQHVDLGQLEEVPPSAQP